MRRLLLCLIAGFFVIASVPQAQESAFSGKNLAFTTGAASPMLMVRAVEPENICTQSHQCAPFAAVRDFIASYAQESATLTTPVSVGTRSTWSVNYLHIDLLPSVRVVVEVQDNLGTVVRDEHTGADALSLLSALNTANMITAGNSLVARILKHLQTTPTHGGVAKIGAGSVTGTPQ